MNKSSSNIQDEEVAFELPDNTIQRQHPSGIHGEWVLPVGSDALLELRKIIRKNTGSMASDIYIEELWRNDDEVSVYFEVLD